MTGFADLAEEAAELVRLCRDKGVKVATAESCTGGLIAGLITEIPGSSAVLERGFVTYSNAAKTGLLDVPAYLIDAEGAVSEQVARKMAEGALAHSNADIAVAVTGIAGPDGGTAEKPVGLVHFALADRAGVRHLARVFSEGDRRAIRFATVRQAFAMIRDAISD